MAELERTGEEHEEEGEAYAAVAVGIAFLAVVVIFGVVATFLASWVFLIPAAACLGWGVSRIVQQRRALPQPVSRDRELLSALRDNGGRITPAEAAMETSLTVKEADALLSELAGGGHLLVESRGGALSYTLPAGSTGQRPELEDRK